MLTPIQHMTFNKSKGLFAIRTQALPLSPPKQNKPNHIIVEEQREALALIVYVKKSWGFEGPTCSV